MEWSGFGDVHDLPPSNPLAKLSERTIRLINTTAAKMAPDNELSGRP